MTEPISGDSGRSGSSGARDLLDPRVCALIGERGFADLSEAQERAIPPLLKGENLVLIAPTGTGKTESAMFPVFDSLLREGGEGFRALYITPLRALNRDILGRLAWWCGHLGLTVGVRHGDTPQNERRKQALNPPNLLITTPETVQALFMGKRLRKHLEGIRHVVVDEIHELAGSKRGAQLAVALERLEEYAGRFQRIGLSATVGNPEDIGRYLCGDRPFRLVEVPVAEGLDLSVRLCDGDFSRQARCVGGLIDASPSSLVFVNTRVTAEALGHALLERGDVDVHHGSLSKEVRVDAEDRFRDGVLRALICTSSMELGIDIGHIAHVVQFGSPREVARLVQRIGRAGHHLFAVSRGTVLATGFDDLLESLVIVRRARASAVEAVTPYVNAADVLANVVAAMAVEYGEVPCSRLLSVVERSGCFTDAASLLDRVCEQMAAHRLIRIEGEGRERRIITTSRARRYLAANLSMIHDERKVPVFDIVTRSTVGTLDESFVVGFVHPGAVFITRGKLWRVLEFEEGRLTVEPAREARGELPSWEGEQIPVPWAVAQEVGALRRGREIGAYTDDPDAARYVAAYLGEMDRNRTPVPTDRLITVENSDEGVVCNICAGHRANETIARVLSILISARHGTSVGIEAGAYRAVLRLPKGIRSAEVRDLLLETDPAHIPGILRLALRRTALFKWKLVQVAKKFGAIDADADYERISIHRLLETFDGTVVQEEAYSELFRDYLDADTAAEVFRSVQGGDVDLHCGPLSILGAEGLTSSRDIIPPPTADQAVITSLKRRIAGDEVILFCMHCKRWKSRTRVERVPERPTCPQCSARLIAALKPWEEDVTAAVRKKKRTTEEEAAAARALRNANLVLTYGKPAVAALAARGVGPETAARICARATEGDAFYREIQKAERKYVLTRRFW
nr:DEAD/DEAH box helicase [Methanofollis fontis]